MTVPLLGFGRRKPATRQSVGAFGCAPSSLIYVYFWSHHLLFARPGNSSNPQTDIQVIFRAVLFRFFFPESPFSTLVVALHMYTHPDIGKINEMASSSNGGGIFIWMDACSSPTVVRICVQLFCFPRAMATGCGGRLVPTTAALMFDLWWHVFSCEKVLLCQERKPLTACVSFIMNGILSETGADRCGLGSSLKVEFWGKNIESCSCWKIACFFFLIIPIQTMSWIYGFF